MYGDLQWTHGNSRWKGDSKVYKVKPIPDFLVPCAFLVGMAGNAQDIITIRGFLQFPELFDKPPRVRGPINGVVLTYDKEIFTFEADFLKWHAFREPYAAAGSGRDFAIGAMAAGLGPKEAVKVACQRDIYSGMGVKGYTIGH